MFTIHCIVSGLTVAPVDVQNSVSCKNPSLLINFFVFL
jgi:hypothetical protein